jgi:pimeloyl-ACP methyl ester carboxylesterase
MRRVAADGIELAIEEAGSGTPPLVLLHGLGGGRWAWDANVPGLSATRRVVAVDLPGHGESDKPPIDYRMPTFAKHVSALVGTLALGPAVLVGNSMGGLVALETALLAPERVAALVLANAAGATRFPIERLPVDPRRFAGVPITIKPPDRVVESYIRFLFVDPSAWGIAHSLAKSKEAIARDDYPAHANAFVRSAIGTFESDAAKRLEAVRCPTLVIWGDGDRLLPKESPEVFARIPGARLERLPGVGHVPQMEAPERFNALVGEFVRTVSR